MVGLGRMGGAMARRLVAGGHRVAGYNRDRTKTEDLARRGVEPAYSLAELAQKLEPPRTVWTMVPAGQATDQVVAGLLEVLAAGDLIIDGGNSFYRDSVRHREQAVAHGVAFLDVGTSGGIWGLAEGYCLMVGGAEEDFHRAEPLFRTLAPPDGYARVGEAGAGHFVKMVHNGIEYGLLQAYAEGFEILHASAYRPDPAEIAALWNQGSVVRSWLLELAQRAFQDDPDLAAVRGFVEDTGEGRWTVAEALAENVPAPVITLSLLSRLRSRQEESFGAKVIAALRREFGGHAVRSERP